MKDHPIIFSGPMVRALLDGRKTMTRRLAWRSETEKRKMDFVCDGERPNSLARKAKGFGVQMGGEYWLRPTPWVGVTPSDRLWARENLQKFNGSKATPSAQYVSTITGVPAAPGDARLITGQALWNWSRDNLPSIHMPRWASRLTLIVTATKIERLQDITNEEAEFEGVKCDMSVRGFRDHFAELWKRLHGPESWDENPEVVALTFTVHKGNIDALPKAQPPSPSATQDTHPTRSG